ncbi:hypothetical protein [Mucilaginibacter polytrichastri]|uniref:Uncharacterized protein n=1 Tax=Mucilaginibacter polytrichastri TaxID=1302689 RepID=A0A1Q6A4L4_9SPHI|nr:hypothetical protein [Mucilaginibacter polytrichastri]OKS88946.1 hypothetical protein RG47T_4424 [Mucilaginibacter polytrichastri]SFT25536.1 hypothetical protein SAMN04487890_12314 [Mucilaginibacter polytrichastri]
MDYKFLLICSIFLLVGFIVSYLFIKPYSQNKDTRGLILKWYPIFALGCIILLVLVSYLQKGPGYFEEGIKQLRANKYINNKVGDFQTYSYMERPKETNPIKFNIELSGKGVNLFLTCTMKYTGQKWILTRIKSDSLRLQRE